MQARSPLGAALVGMLRTSGGCRGRPPPATSAGCHGNGGNFPVGAAGSCPSRAPGCETKIRSLSRGSKMDERRPPGRGTGCLGNPRNPFSFRGNALSVGGDYTELKEPEIGPALPPLRALSAGRSRRAQRSGLHSRPPPLFPCANPAGPTRPARSRLLKPRRRVWRLRASTGV